MKLHVQTTINGHDREFLCEPAKTLLSVLRNELQLYGAKEGCGTGDCGSCSVILDDTLVCACLVLAVEVAGRQLRTVEGLSEANGLTPLQNAFLRHGALQCGICTPGILMAATALLEKNPAPTESEVRFGIAGNLCRCTGYDKIVRAILDVAHQQRVSE
jgi:aerobic carbon-monoxide dehydrogenase small subunit